MVTTDLSYAWNDAYSVGIQEVDEQHKVLLQLLDALHLAIRAGQGAESLAVLNQLVDYTRHHFTMEESLMRVTNYPDFGPHKELHQNLMAQIHKVQDELAGGQLDLDGEMLQFVKIWLIQHINETDRRFGKFFHSTGLEPQWSPAVAEAMGKKSGGGSSGEPKGGALRLAAPERAPARFLRQIRATDGGGRTPRLTAP